MKNGLENIDKIIKQAFDGFEGNVNPNVWNNVQNAIKIAPNTATPNIKKLPSNVSAITKVVALKIAVVVVVASGIVSSIVYFQYKNKANITSENKNVAQVKNNLDNKKIKETASNNKEEKININRSEEKNIKNKLIEKSPSVQNSKNSFPAQTSTDNTNIKEEKSFSSYNNKESENKNNSNEEKDVPNQKTSKNAEQEKLNKIVIAKPKVKILASKTSGQAPLDIDFDNENDGVVSYLWDFGDNSDVSSLPNPIHHYDKPGKYNVSLTVLNDKNVENTTYKTIVVTNPQISSLDEIPNIFTPNGDGQNDYFQITGKNIDRIELFVMDAKGKVVYKINSLDVKWDGTDMSGHQLLSGTYYISGMVMGIDNVSYTIKKTVALVR